MEYIKPDDPTLNWMIYHRGKERLTEEEHMAVYWFVRYVMHITIWNI